MISENKIPINKNLKILLQNFNCILCEVITLKKRAQKHMCPSVNHHQWKACVTTVEVKKDSLPSPQIAPS